MTELPEGLSPHARSLAAWFVAEGRSTFTLKDHLWAAAVTVSPGSSGTGERRRILSEALHELSAAGVVRLSGTDRERTALPTRVRLLVSAPPAPRVGPDPWHQDMARMTVSGTSVPRSPHTTLGKINRWVVRGRRGADPEPRQERALEVTGNEKAFDRLGPDVDPDAFDRVMATYRVDMPLMRRQVVGAGPVLLVIENLATFDSIGRVLRDAPGGPIGEIFWGEGNQVRSSVRSLCHDPPAAIRYFGDLDAAGLRIPAAASALAEQMGLPPVRPATGLYALLLAHGTRADHAVVEPDRARELVDWLDPEHRDAVAGLLVGGGRYAQEACRRSVLAAESGWRDQLDGA